MTVPKWLDSNTLEETGFEGTDWAYPTDVGVLKEDDERYATANAADKNIDSGSSEGQGVGVVTGQEGRVVGTPESTGCVLGETSRRTAGLRQTASWRNYPVSDDVAMLFQKGQDLIERCVYRSGGMETYALPYFAGEMTEPESRGAVSRNQLGG